MALSSPTDNILATNAQIRLDRLRRDHAITPFYAGDELTLCAGCSFVIVNWGEGWRHSDAEIRAMRALAEGGAWPR